MDALAAYGSSDEGSGPEDTHGEPSIDPEESSSVLHKLKEKFPLDSAPSVPKRVSARGRIDGRFLEYYTQSLMCCRIGQEEESSLLRVDRSSKVVTYNPTVEQLFTPEVRADQLCKTS